MSTLGGFTFNAIDFGIYGLTIGDEFETPGAANRRVDSIGLPGANKVLFSRAVSAPVEIEIPVRIAASSAANLVTNLGLIEAGLLTTTDTLLSIPVAYSDRGWLARWDGEQLRYRRRGTCAVSTTIKFLAQPEKAGATPTTGSQAISGTTNFTIAAGGNLYTRPIWTFRNTAVTAIAAGLEMWNTTVGDSLIYNNAIPAGHYIKYYSDTYECYYSADGSTWTAAAANAVTAGADWLTLKGGISNAISVLGATTGTLSWSYTARFS